MLGSLFTCKRKEENRVVKSGRKIRKLNEKNEKSHTYKTKKRTWKTILMTVFFLLGLGIFAYPLISNLYANFFHTRVIDSYQKEVRSKSAKQKKELRKQMINYNNSLSKTPVTESDPFREDEKIEVPKHKVIDALEKELGEVLGILTIPKISSELPIYGGSSELQLQKGVGVLTGTSLPVGEEGTHSVITGHRGLPSSKLFTDLPKLEIGDQFTIEILGEKHLYEIDLISTVLPQDTQELQVIKDKEYVTLLTCTPYMINTHRLLVRGHRVPIIEKKKEPRTAYDHHLILVVVAFSIFVWVSFLSKKRKRQKENEVDQ